MNPVRYSVALLLIFTATVACAQQPIAGAAGSPPMGNPSTPPLVSTYAPVTSAEDYWIRGDYVVWTATTRRGLELGQELSSNPLFNNLLELTGTSQTDLIRSAFQNRIGYRLTAGKWLDSDTDLGIEAGAFYYYRQSVNVPLTSADAIGPAAAGIGLPALVGAGGGNVAVPINTPLANGLINFELDNLLIYNFQVLGRARLLGNDNCRLDGLLGVRRLEVEGTLGIDAAATGLAAPLLAGSTIATRESIFAESIYTGPVIGVDFQEFLGPVDIGFRPQITIAYIHTTVNREAQAQANIPGAGAATINGSTFLPFAGLQGETSTGWTVIPEAELRLGCTLSDHCRIVAGASFMVVPDVSRTEGQVLFGIPANRLLAAAGGIPQAGNLVSPTRETLFVLTGSIGLEFRF